MQSMVKEQGEVDGNRGESFVKGVLARGWPGEAFTKTSIIFAMSMYV